MHLGRPRCIALKANVCCLDDLEWVEVEDFIDVYWVEE